MERKETNETSGNICSAYPLNYISDLCFFSCSFSLYSFFFIFSLNSIFLTIFSLKKTFPRYSPFSRRWIFILSLKKNLHSFSSSFLCKHLMFTLLNLTKFINTIYYIYTYFIHLWIHQYNKITKHFTLMIVYLILFLLITLLFIFFYK